MLKGPAASTCTKSGNSHSRNATRKGCTASASALLATREGGSARKGRRDDYDSQGPSH